MEYGIFDKMFIILIDKSYMSRRLYKFSLQKETKIKNKIEKLLLEFCQTYGIVDNEYATIINRIFRISRGGGFQIYIKRNSARKKSLKQGFTTMLTCNLYNFQLEDLFRVIQKEALCFSMIIQRVENIEAIIITNVPSTK